MQVSQSAGYAIHGLLYLHLHGKGKPVQLRTIAQGLDVSESYLSKIFQILAKSSLVSSFRGAKGGFLLMRSAEEISLREVIEMIDGSIVQSKCFMGRPDCNERNTCKVYQTVYRLRQYIYDTLEGISIVDLDHAYFQAPGLRKAPVLHPSKEKTEERAREMGS